MTRKQAKMFAKIHSGVHLSYIDSFAFLDCNIPDKDQDKILDEVYKISDKVRGELPEIADSKLIYEYVMTNF